LRRAHAGTLPAAPCQVVGERSAFGGRCGQHVG
jgi:hypothetical protein